MHDDARRFRIDPDVVLGSRRDVAFAARRASHDHAAADSCRDLGTLRQSQRNVGQRPERDQNKSGIRFDRIDDGVDGMQFFRRLSRRGIVVIAQSVAPMKPGRILIGAKQRLRRARDKPGHPRRKVQLYRERCAWLDATVHVAGDDCDRGHANVGRAQGHDQGDCVVGSSVGIDEKCARHGRSIAEGRSFSTSATSGQLCLVAGLEEEYSYTFSKGDNDVHAAEFNDRAVDDDRQRDLLGFVGQHLQGRQELSFRTFLLGLCDRHFSDFSDSRFHDGQQRARLDEFRE